MSWVGARYYCGLCQRDMDMAQAAAALTVAGPLWICADCRGLLTDETLANELTLTPLEVDWLHSELRLNRKLPVQVAFLN